MLYLQNAFLRRMQQVLNSFLHYRGHYIYFNETIYTTQNIMLLFFFLSTSLPKLSVEYLQFYVITRGSPEYSNWMGESTKPFWHYTPVYQAMLKLSFILKYNAVLLKFCLRLQSLFLFFFRNTELLLTKQRSNTLGSYIIN